MSGEILLTPGFQFSESLDETITQEKLNRLVREIVVRVMEGAITSRELASGSITADKLAATLAAQLGIPNDSITTDKLVNLCVTAAKLAEDAVTADKVGDRELSIHRHFSKSVCVDRIPTADLTVPATTYYVVPLDGGSFANGVTISADNKAIRVDQSGIYVVTAGLRIKNLSAAIDGTAFVIRSDAVRICENRFYKPAGTPTEFTVLLHKVVFLQSGIDFGLVIQNHTHTPNVTLAGGNGAATFLSLCQIGAWY